MHVAVDGATQPCDVCQQEHEVPPRLEAVVELNALPVDERLELLRQADPALPGVPPEVQALTEADGVLLQHKGADEALGLWQQTQAAIRDEGDDARLRATFFHLTMLLYRHMKAQRDDLRLRAVLESAVEATAGHRDQQIFRCVLSRAAARAGDVPAAEDWLTACDARSRDLHADGAYRYTAAYISTYKKHYPRVLDLLGMRVGDIPFANNLDVICSVLRANAHERTDDLDAATLEVCDCIGRAPGAAVDLERVIRGAGDLALCRKSFVLGRRMHDGLSSGSPKKTGASLAPSSSNLKKALPWVVPSLFFLGLAVMTPASSTLAGGLRMHTLFFALAATFAVPFVVLMRRRGS